MEIGDLVRFRHSSETDIGIVVSFEWEVPTSYIFWSDGDSGWYDNEDLEVINA